MAILILWLAIGVFGAAVLSFTYATVVGAFTRLEKGVSGATAVLMTVGTFVGLFALIISEAKQVDAGGLFVQFVFIVIASACGCPLGLILSKAAIENFKAASRA